ncbi:MAG: carboxypeptidase regulatory-like domain-containing protein [Terracidiphilus sp.]
MTFPITASAALRIAVTDDFGEPVEKAQIYLFHRVHSNGMGEQLTPWKLPPTKGTGEGAVYLLEPGDYYVAVSAHPWYALNNITESGTPPVAHPANPALDVAYPTTYFDGVTNEAEATAVTLAPGSRERIAITLHAVPAVRVTLPAPPAGVGDEGQVERPPELLPIIFGAPMEQPDRSTMEESERGGTEITGVAPGAYEVREGERRRRVLLNLSHSQDLSSNAGSGAAALKVTIKGIAKNALPADARLFLFWGDKTHPRQPMQAKFENNECEFGIVPPGNWELFIGAGMSGFPIIATSFDGQMHTGNRLHVMGKPLDVELSVRTAPTVVDGFAMREGKGKAGVLVLLVPHDPENHTDLIRRDQSDSDGSFTSRAVPPGAYTVVAIENGWNLEWQRPEILARYLPGGVVVSVPDQPEPLYHLTAAVPIQAPITSVTSEPEHQEVRQVR